MSDRDPRIAILLGLLALSLLYPIIPSQPALAQEDITIDPTIGAAEGEGAPQPAWQEWREITDALGDRWWDTAAVEPGAGNATVSITTTTVGGLDAYNVTLYGTNVGTGVSSPCLRGVARTWRVGIRPNTWIPIDPHWNNLTLWWYVDELTHPETVVSVSFVASDGVEDYAIHIVLAHGAGASLLNFTGSFHYTVSLLPVYGADVGTNGYRWITGANVPNFNVTGQWNRFSVNFHDLLTRLGMNRVWVYGLIFMGATFQDYADGVVKVYFASDVVNDYHYLRGVTRENYFSQTTTVSSYYWVRDGENATWRFNMTIPATTYEQKVHQNWTWTFPKGHEVINVTAPDGSLFTGYNVYSYNATHYKIEILDAGESGSFLLYTRSPNIVYDIRTYESDLGIGTTWFDPGEPVTVAVRVRDSTTGAFLQGARVTPFILDGAGNVVAKAEGLSDAEGWFNFTFAGAPPDIGATFYVQANATYRDRQHVGIRYGAALVTALNVTWYELDHPDAYTSVVTAKVQYAHDGSTEAGIEVHVEFGCRVQYRAETNATGHVRVVSRDADSEYVGPVTLYGAMSPRGITTALLNKTLVRAGYQVVEAHPERPVAFPEHFRADAVREGALVVSMPINATGWTTKVLYDPVNHTIYVFYRGVLVNATEIPVDEIPAGRIRAYAWTRGEHKILTYTTNNITLVMHEWDEAAERLRVRTEDLPSGTTVVLRIDWSLWGRQPQRAFAEDTWGRRELPRFGTLADLEANPEGWFVDLADQWAILKTVARSASLITVEFALPAPPPPPPPPPPPAPAPAPPPAPAPIQPTPEQVEVAREWILTVALEPRAILLVAIAIGLLWAFTRRRAP